MKKQVTYALSLGTLGLILTACGDSGGGGFGAMTPTPAPTPTTTATPAPAPDPISTNTGGTGSLFGGGTTTVTGTTTTGTATGNAPRPTNTSTGINTGNTASNNNIGTGIGSTDTTKPTPTNNINVGIQGAKMEINTATGASNISPTVGTSEIGKVVIGDKIIELDSRNLRTGSRFDNLSYGYLTQNNTTPTLFVQGNVSSSVPVRGQATYRGNAVHVRANGSNPVVQVVPATFNVDFANKTLTGKIQASNALDLSATISGNRFSGTKDNVATQGYFYGTDASELGGVYHNDDGSLSGAYGAKK